MVAVLETDITMIEADGKRMTSATRIVTFPAGIIRIQVVGGSHFPQLGIRPRNRSVRVYALLLIVLSHRAPIAIYIERVIRWGYGAFAPSVTCHPSDWPPCRANRPPQLTTTRR